MPRGDGTGPMGMGPMTGRGAGYCAGVVAPDYKNCVGFAGGFGYGRGFRRKFNVTGLPGWGRFGYPTYAAMNESAASEKEILKSQAELLENKLQQVKKRLSSLKEDSE